MTTGRPTRVLQVLSSDGVGGTERMVSALVGGLDPGCIASHVAMPDARGPVAEDLRQRGAPVHRLPAPGAPLRTARRLAALFGEHRFDVVHVYGMRMSLIGRVAVRLTAHRPGFVIGIRGLHLADWPQADAIRTRLAVRLERVCSVGVDLYVANSRSGARFLIERGLPAERFRVVPNGVDVEFWTPAMSAPPAGPPLIACVANLRPVKRLDLAVDAAAALRDLQAGPFQVVIAGEGALRATLKSQVRRLHLEDTVKFAGELHAGQIRELLRRAEFSLMTSAWEGMPVSLLEAMSCACPVAATNVPGIADLVRHDETGLLADSTPEGLARACHRLLTEPVLRARLGARAREVAVAEYSLARMVAAHQALYRELGRPGGATR